MRKLLMTTAAMTMVVGMAAGPARAADSVEVLHCWTSGGEAAALEVLKKDLESKGVSWTDMPIAGGGCSDAMTVLRTRVTAGNPPTAVLMMGFDLLDWAKEGALGNLDEVASKEGWDNVIPQALQRFSKYDGHWIAAPVNVHSTNWMWISKAALDKAGGKQPETWDELIAMLDDFKTQGIIPVAQGGQAWQEATLFDAVVLSFGADFYKQAFIDLDPAALGGETMKEAFDRMTKLHSYVDGNFSGRDWNLASAMVIEGKAGMQFMGDWAKGEFIKAGKKPGVDFVCLRFPGTQGAVTFNADQFAMFKLADDKVPAQLKMASAVENPAFQSAFNIIKGSVPARTDVADTDFDDCGKKGIRDVAEASAGGTLLGSMAHGHANPTAVKNAIYDVVTRQFNGELSSEDAIKELVVAVEAAK